MITLDAHIKFSLEKLFLNKRIKDDDKSFVVKSIEISNGYDGLEILFMDRVRDWPTPKFVRYPGQNTVTPKGEWVNNTPKDLQIAWFCLDSVLPEVVN